MKAKSTVSELKRRAREAVVKTLYQMEMGGTNREEAVMIIRRKTRPADIREFAVRLIEATIDNMDAIDRTIAEVAENWDLSRMAAVDRNALRLGVAEIVFIGDVPAKVSINEAIEIVKRFSTEQSGRFVNGILDRVARTKSEIRDSLGHPR